MKPKLTPEMIEALRREYNTTDVTYAALARRLGVKGETISAAINGRTWVEDRRSHLTPEDVRAIRESDGPCGEVGKRYGVSASTVSSIRRRIVWADVA